MAITFNGISIGLGVALTITPPPNPQNYLWGWGRNYGGALGLGDTNNRSSPVQVGLGYNTVSAGSLHTIAIKPNGTLWSWGRNNLGQLGQGDTTSVSSPIQVGALTTWSNIAAAGSISMAIKTDGTLWAIGGYNYQGQLGLNADTGTFVGKSSPIQVGALTDWLRIASGGYHCLAVKTNGTLWSWGSNLGALGLGDTVYRSSPVQVGGDNTWSTISAGFYHSLAVKSNGTMWGWGENTYNGRLGLGDTTDRLNPTQIGALTTWTTVSAGANYGVAVKTDGTMWSWGYNGSFGSLGLGDTTDRSSPVQVGALTNWLRVAGGENTLFGIKTDGTLWSSGHNNYGQLGDGTTNNRSSPVQVGALTTWSSVASGRSHVMAFASV